MKLEDATPRQLRERLAELAGADPDVVNALADILEAMDMKGAAADGLRKGENLKWLFPSIDKALVKMAEIMGR